MLTAVQIAALNEVIYRGDETTLRDSIAPQVTSANMTNEMLTLAWQEQRIVSEVCPISSVYGTGSSARETWFTLCNQVREAKNTTLRSWMERFIEKQPRLIECFQAWQQEANAELEPLFDQRLPFIREEEDSKAQERTAWRRRFYAAPMRSTDEEWAVYQQEYQEHLSRLSAIEAIYRPQYVPLIEKHAERWAFWQDELIRRMCDPVLEIALATLRRKNPTLLLILAELQQVQA